MTKAKLFTTGGSQAVRLPAEFRFEGSEVDIRRDPVTYFRSPQDHGMIISTGRKRWIFLTTSWKNVISPRTTCAIQATREHHVDASLTADNDPLTAVEWFCYPPRPRKIRIA
jgi:virulence-associated protein VagC